jgi:AcrR family transcriptional regulator
VKQDDWQMAPLPSGRHGLSREYVLTSQRMRLLDAALVVAGNDGYGAMTVTALTKRAGVSRKTFYELFADREQCFLAAFDELAQRGLVAAHDAFATAESWPERLTNALAVTLAGLAAHPHQARFAFLEVLAAGPRAIARRDAAVRAALPFLRPGFDASPRGVAIPGLMPDAIAGGLCELVAAAIRNGRVDTLPQLLPDLLFCAFAPFVGPAEAARLASAVPATATA